LTCVLINFFTESPSVNNFFFFSAQERGQEERHPLLSGEPELNAQSIWHQAPGLFFLPRWLNDKKTSLPTAASFFSFFKSDMHINIHILLIKT
jgi:hypothetical protein